MNNVILVGRITGSPELIEIEEGKKVSSVLLAVNRNFKNADGLYDTDFVRCVLWNSIAENTIEYCRAGDVIGVKGRLQTHHYEDENGKVHHVTDVVAERINFLSSNKNRETTNENRDER